MPKYRFQFEDDWFAYYIDVEGNWRYVMTECAPEWIDTPDTSVRNIAARMIANGYQPRLCPHVPR